MNTSTNNNKKILKQTQTNSIPLFWFCNFCCRFWSHHIKVQCCNNYSFSISFDRYGVIVYASAFFIYAMIFVDVLQYEKSICVRAFNITIFLFISFHDQSEPVYSFCSAFFLCKLSIIFFYCAFYSFIRCEKWKIDTNGMAEKKNLSMLTMSCRAKRIKQILHRHDKIQD